MMLGSAWRKTLTLIASLALVSAVCVTLGYAGGYGDSGDAVPTKLVILHTNDVHGYAQSADGVLGVAAVAQLKADYQAEGYDVLLLDSGDALQGNSFVNDSQGSIVPDFMNAAGYDAMALGNHEFDYGADVLQKRMEACGFPVLGANVTVDATGERFAQSNTVFTLSDGTKVGVFGIVTPEAKTKSSPRNTAGLSIAQGDDLFACVQEQVDDLHAQGCTQVVCLGHLGDVPAVVPNTAADVVQHTTGIDVFIDGHDHEVENRTVEDRAGRKVLIVETGCYLASVGVLTCENGRWAESLVTAGSYDGADEDVARMIDAEAADEDARMSQVVATTPFELDGGRYPGNRDRETNYGDLSADAYLWEATQVGGAAPDAAIVNGGNVRATVQPGDITLRAVHDTMPFGSQLCAIEVTGAQLLEALEAATQNLPDEMGGFPQVSGITYTVDATVPYKRGNQYPDSTYYAPAEPGARVTVSDVNGKGFDPDATYVIATSDFIATGGDTYHVFTTVSQDTKRTLGYADYQALQYYLSDELGGSVPARYEQPQGRITVIGSRS